MALTLEQIRNKSQAGSQNVSQLDRSKQVAEESGGFFSRVGERLSNRFGNVKEGYGRQFAGEQTAPETGLQITGNLIGGAFDVLGEAATSAFRSLPNPLENAVREKTSTIMESPSMQYGLRMMAQGAESYTSWKRSHPRAAANLEAAGNMASVIPVMKAAQVGAKGASHATPFIGEGISRTAGVAREATEKALQNQKTRIALDVVKPKLTAKEAEKALAKGGVESRGVGVFKTFNVKDDGSLLRIARSVEDVVDNKKMPTENIEAIRAKIEMTAEQVGKELERNNSIFNTKQFATYLNEVKQESRVVFGGDAQLENAYNSVIDQMITLINKEGRKKNVAGLWAARKEFDNIIERKFPNVFKRGADTDNVRANAILDIRRAVNDFVDEKLPEGSTYKNSLREMSDMYSAIDNVAYKSRNLVGKGTTEKLMTALRRNLLVYGATGGILTFGAFSGILTNPFIIGGILLGGTYKIGKNVITSQTLKKVLIKTLEGIEKAAKPKNAKKLAQMETDKASLREMIGTIDKYNQENQPGMSIRSTADAKKISSRMDGNDFVALEKYSQALDSGRLPGPGDPVYTDAQRVLSAMGVDVSGDAEKRFLHDVLSYKEQGMKNVPVQPFKEGAVPQTADLMQEARKYKSAEEFVASKGKPIYHGTNKNFDVIDPTIGGEDGMPIGKLGTWFTDQRFNAENVVATKTGDYKLKPRIVEAYADFKNPKVYQTNSRGYEGFSQLVNDIEEYSGKMWKTWSKNGDFFEKPINEPAKRFREKLIQDGYDGIIIKSGNSADGIQDVQYVALKTTSIKTKSQLTDIWNKANKK